jgi:hypothetical protein
MPQPVLALAVLQDIRALLQRLHQPTAAKVAAEHANLSRLNTILLRFSSGRVEQLPMAPLPREQMSALMHQWCDITKSLLTMLKEDARAVNQYPACPFAASMLLSLLANCLECWVEQAPREAAQAALKQQVAQHTSGEQLEQHKERGAAVIKLLWNRECGVHATLVAAMRQCCR